MDRHTSAKSAHARRATRGREHPRPALPTGLGGDGAQAASLGLSGAQAASLLV